MYKKTTNMTPKEASAAIAQVEKTLAQKFKRKPRRTEEQKMERAEKITTALYAAEMANVVNTLRGSMNVHQRPLYPEVAPLALAMMDRAAKLLLAAFDGHIDGKKFPKLPKAP